MHQRVSDSVSIMKILGGTFGPVATNSYVVFADTGGPALIVDPAAGSHDWLAHTLAAHDLTAEAVWTTHGHWDHVVEAYRWADTGIPIWAGSGDEEWLAAPAPFNPALFGNPPVTPGVTPARILGDGDQFSVGPLDFVVMHTPGHSPGCYVAVEQTHGEAIVGDLIFAQGIGRTDFPRSSHTDMIRSLTRVINELPPATRIYPGHGPWGVTMEEATPWTRMFM
jgi:hydroxyacylglutathione hydrolase